MSEPRAQRTLVKSPPELWAEISDVSTLARHLGEFGEIRITRLDAETTVVWEGDRARGTVELEPSGWGTKVTITAEAIAVAGAETAEEAKPLADETPAAEADTPATVEGEPVAEAVPVEEAEAVAETEPVAEAEAVAETEPVAQGETPAVEETPAAQVAARRRGFFARFFGRRAEPEAPAA